MDEHKSAHESALERRLEHLEARVSELEQRDIRRAPDQAARPPAGSGWILPSATPTGGARPAAVTAAPTTTAATASSPGPVPAAPTAQPSGSIVGWVSPHGDLGGKVPWSGTVPGRPAIPTLSLRDVEARLTGRALAWVGGIALVLGAVYFLGLAFTRGWISEELRVVIGLVAGTVALAVGAVLMERNNRLIGHVIAPVGLAVISVSMVGATRLYDLIPVWLGLLVVLASAIAAAAAAIRADSPVVAAFGLVAVLASPPLLGATPDVATLLFVAAVLVGTTIVALWRSWTWLPPIAFVLAAPQAAAWILGRPESLIGLVGIGSFWALNVVAAAGEEVRRHRRDLSPSSASLLLANVAFLVWAGFELLSGTLTGYRGLFLVVVSLAQMSVGAYFLRRDGDQSLFGLLAVATGIAAVTMAAPVQFAAPVVPVAWVAEAAALAWVAVRRSHRYSAVVSALLFALAGSAMVWVSYVDRASLLPDAVGADRIPFLDPLGAALAFFIGGVACGVWIVRETRYVSPLAALGLLITTICVPVELAGTWLVAAWALLMVLGFGVARWLADGRHASTIPDLLRTVGRTWSSGQSLPLASLVAGGLAIGHVLMVELPLSGFGRVMPPEIPFTDAGAAAAVALVDAFLASAIIAGGRAAVRVAALGTGAVVAYAIPFEVYAWAVSVLWVGLAVATIGLGRIPAFRHPAFRFAAVGLLIGAVGVAIAIVAPIMRLFVVETAVEPLVILQSLAAFGAVIGGAIAYARTEMNESVARWVWVAAGVASVYALSVALVDVVGQTMRAGVGLEELQTRGQVALSLLWAGLGIVAFMLGLQMKRALLREAGLVLLAVATVKVFAFDLAALDVAYRVISLIVLGLVLLASAWLWQHNQPKPPIHGGMHRV